jgi:hypothetical protein
MNICFSSTTGPALLAKEEDIRRTAVSLKARDSSSGNEERVAPLAGTKRPRQDDSISECRGTSKIARSSLILIQRSNTIKAL